MTVAWLVWMRGLRGPKAEIWRDHVDIYRSRSEGNILSLRKLTDAELREPLDRLASKYRLERLPEE